MQYDVKRCITVRRVVIWVQYKEDQEQFLVTSRDIKADYIHEDEAFDYVINASGHCNFPQLPIYKGIDMFIGRVIHSRDFRNADEFRGLAVLFIGSSFAADDIAVHLVRFGGARRVIVSHRYFLLNLPDGSYCIYKVWCSKI